MRGKFFKSNESYDYQNDSQSFDLLISSTIYREIMQIAQEIEQCRASI